jgi:hypothetical protein
MLSPIDLHRGSFAVIPQILLDTNLFLGRRVGSTLRPD